MFPGNELLYDTRAYWCPHRWEFTLDCSHLVEPLQKPHVAFKGWPYVEAAYDRDRRILELWDNCGQGSQYRGVSLSLARGMVKAPNPNAFYDAHIKRRYPFRRVRGRLTVAA